MFGRRNKEYLSDYKTDYSKSRFSDERYIYTGQQYIFDGSGKTLKKIKILGPVFSVSAFASLICAGLVRSHASGTWYVILPYVFSFLPAVLFIINIVKFAFSGEYFRRNQKDKFGKSLFRSSHIGAILSFVTLAALVPMGLTKGFSSGDVVFAVLDGLAAVFLILCISLSRYVKFRKSGDDL